VSSRHAACSCGQLDVTTEGDPVVVYVCHCLSCQRRTGSVFGSGARFRKEQVQIAGQSREFERVSDNGVTRTFHFCPNCGTTVFAKTASVPGFVTVFIGAFADPAFPPPTESLYETRRHRWVTIPGRLQPNTASP
jgi:hypothetical protein